MPVRCRTGDTTLRKEPDRQTSARRAQAPAACSLSLGRQSRTEGSRLPGEIRRATGQGPRSRPCSPERGRQADRCRLCHVDEPDGIRSGPSTECQPGMSDGAGTKPAETTLQQVGSPQEPAPKLSTATPWFVSGSRNMRGGRPSPPATSGGASATATAGGPISRRWALPG